jgi:hypothetical protein
MLGWRIADQSPLKAMYLTGSGELTRLIEQLTGCRRADMRIAGTSWSR